MTRKRNTRQVVNEWLLGAFMPLAATAALVFADVVEGPKTAYVGVMACVPLLAAIFSSPVVTGGVSAIAWIVAFIFGQVASDGNVMAQTVRLGIIAGMGLLAIVLASIRVRNEQITANAIAEAAQSQAYATAAMIDPMTKLPNRLGMAHTLQELDWLTRSVVLFDCDKLKIVNDQFGHLAGDAYIEKVAEALRSTLPSEAIIGRWGGDEFLAIVPTGADDAENIVKEVLRSISTSTIAIGAQNVTPRLSAGVSEWVFGQTIERAISDADDAMYAAKSAGGNRVKVAD